MSGRTTTPYNQTVSRGLVGYKQETEPLHQLLIKLDREGRLVYTDNSEDFYIIYTPTVLKTRLDRLSYNRGLTGLSYSRVTGLFVLLEKRRDPIYCNSIQEVIRQYTRVTSSREWEEVDPQTDSHGKIINPKYYGIAGVQEHMVILNKWCEQNRIIGRFMGKVVQLVNNKAVQADTYVLCIGNKWYMLCTDYNHYTFNTKLTTSTQTQMVEQLNMLFKN